MAERLQNMAEPGAGEGSRLYIADASGQIIGTRTVGREQPGGGPSFSEPSPRETAPAGVPPVVPPPPDIVTPQTPEGPPQEPDRNSLEYEASPERGREIAEGIIKWEAMRAAGRYGEVNWTKLNQLYREQRIYIAVQRKVRLQANIYQPEEESTTLETEEAPKVNPDRFNGLVTLDSCIEEYRRNPGIIRDPRFINAVNTYFDEAKKVGLLKDLDIVLASAYKRDVIPGITRGLRIAEIMQGNRRSGVEGVEEKIQMALESVRGIYGDRQWTDENIDRLAGVWELYASFARQRFVAAINNRDTEGVTQRPYAIDQEFRLGEEEGDIPEETYWRNTENGYYIQIYARTQEEFTIAAESYISMLKSMTSDPQEVFREATQFITQMNRVGKERGIESNHLKKLTDQIYGRLGAFGADHANELYHGDQYKQYLDFINKDGGGPDRYLELLKLFDGEPAAALFMLDKDPRWEILFSLYGSRGQLARSSHAQRGRGDVGLFNHVREIFIEEMMGIRIKDKRNIKDKNGESNLTKFMSDREFAGMFDGLYIYDRTNANRYNYDSSDPGRNQYGDANIKVYRQFGDIPEKQIPAGKRQAWRLGRIQIDLRPITQGGNGKKLNELSKRDQRLYNEARERAEKAFEIAFELYGILGEKSKRGGGVFKVWKEDAQREKYQDFVPIHYAEKFVQFVETMTKMKYADLSARDRTAKVKEARDRAIEEFKKNGYEAKPFNADGTPMKLKRPRENPDTGEVIRDAAGNVVVEEVDVDFYTATHHAYSNWTSHTYWSYQEEDRQMLLDPVTFATARRIRAGEIRIEDVKDPWALQLLILDPTLKRVRRFPSDFEDRERKLTMAAVEDSYQSHWRITRELHRKFFPTLGTPAKDIGIYYGLQDFGGYRKMIENMRAQIAEDPERFARRGRRLLPDLHNPAAALSEIWGQGTQGVMGIMRMFDAPVYRMAGAMALDKFSAQSEIAGKIWEALIGGTDREGNYVEGLLLKLTNNSDKLSAIVDKIPDEGKQWESVKGQSDFCYALMESLGRLQRYEQLLTVMETKIRNASGAQWLEEIDILTDNGQLDPEFERRLATMPDITREGITRDDLTRFLTEAEAVEEMSEEEFNGLFNTGNKEIAGIDEGGISANTGSGRHSAKILHEAFGRLLIDEEIRGGGDLYQGEKFPYSRINDRIIIIPPKRGGRVTSVPTNDTIWTFIFGKFVPT